MNRMNRGAFLGAVLAGMAFGGFVANLTPAQKAISERAIAPTAVTRKQFWGGGAGGRKRRGARPGWSVAEGKRRACKSRNRLRHKARARG